MIDGLVHLDLPGAPQTGAPARRGGLPWIAGPENSLVVPPVTELLGRGATRWSPLVLVGPAGSGKSHLVQGIVRQLRSARHAEVPRGAQPADLRADSSPSLGVTALYFTAADFAREFHSAVTEDRAAAWRDDLLAAELLAIENLEELRPDSPAQLELRSLIDAFAAAGKGTILITADREPLAINHLDLGLRDRLSSGLTVRLERPGLAARRQILQLVASARGWELSDAQVSTLARRDVGVASQLFGALLKHVHDRDHAAEASASDAADNAGDSVLSRASLKQILAATARWFGVTQADIVGHSRKTAFVRARNVVVCLARRLTSLSYASIGHALGGRDHTTIMHAEARAAEQAAADSTLQQAIDELDRILR